MADSGLFVNQRTNHNNRNIDELNIRNNIFKINLIFMY